MSGLLTATLMGSIAEDLDWLGTLLGGLTIMPYVSHSVYGGQPYVVVSSMPGLHGPGLRGSPVYGHPPSPSTMTRDLPQVTWLCAHVHTIGRICKPALH